MRAAQVLKVDASEGSMLQGKLGFRTVPMCICYFEGRLVTVTNAISSREDLAAVCIKALEDGRKGVVKPDGE